MNVLYMLELSSCSKRKQLTDTVKIVQRKEGSHSQKYLSLPIHVYHNQRDVFTIGILLYPGKTSRRFRVLEDPSQFRCILAVSEYMKVNTRLECARNCLNKDD